MSRNEDILEELIDNRVTIECIDIRISPEADSEAIVYSGPGIITQQEEWFEIRCFTQLKLNLNVAFSRLTNNKDASKDLNGPFVVVAHDSFGGVWLIKDVELEAGGLIGHPNGLIVSAKYHEMRKYKDDYPQKGKAFCRVILPYKIRHPANHRSEITTEIAGRSVFTSSAWDVWEYDIDGHIIQVHCEPDRTYIDIKSSTATIDDQIIRSVLESLKFVLATEMEWCFYSMISDHTNTIRIRSIPKRASRERKTIFQTPLRIAFGGDTNDFQEMSRCLFRYLIGNPGPSADRIVQAIGDAMRAGKSTIQTAALVLSVSVESILKLFNEFHDFVNGSDCDIKQLSDYVDRWNGDERLKGRLLGMISQLSVVRPNDVLRILVDRSAISSELSGTWTKLRNQMAHANELSSDINVKWRKYQRVLVLFHQLVFLRIGYVGKYTDRGNHQASNGSFDHKLSLIMESLRSSQDSD